VENFEATELKGKGNDAFKAGKFEDAVSLFSEAITHDEDNAILYNNRAMAQASLGRWAECVFDAMKSIKLNKKYSKAYYQLVKGLIKAGKLREARQYLLVAFQECEKSESNKEFKQLEADLGLILGCPVRPKPGDFDILDEIGDGNFSKIYKACLKSSKREFAIKMIEVATVERMKRRHRNINNEIMMEKAVLARLDHPNVVTLFATFKDYGSLYYQMEFMHGGELWRCIRDDDPVHLDETNNDPVAMVGLCRSRTRFIIAQAINGLEYIHSQGIVHRDVKPENMLLTREGHLKFVDFGTAKDLIDTKLNGPEFVGTPEYMAPSAVNSKKSGPEADLWALGVVLYQLIVGFTPFAASSPYLSFLRIKRALLRRPSFCSDEEWELLSALIVKDPKERIELAAGPLGGDGTDLELANSNINYDRLRLLPYFRQDQFLLQSDSGGDGGGEEGVVLERLRSLHTRDAVTIPTLAEMSRRAVARAAVVAAGAIAEVGGVKEAVEDTEAEGGGNMGWVRRFTLVPGANPGVNSDGNTPVYPRAISPEDREYIYHYLHRRNQLDVPCLYRLFWGSTLDSKCVRVDPTSMDYNGHSFKAHGSWPEKQEQVPFYFYHIAGPGIGDASSSSSISSDTTTFASMKEGVAACSAQSERQLAAFKGIIGGVNRFRPKFVVVCGNFTALPHPATAAAASNSSSVGVHAVQTELFRRHVSRFSDSISLLFVPGPHEMGMRNHRDANGKSGPSKLALKDYHGRFGLDYYGFWYQGVRVLVVNSSLFFVDTASVSNDSDSPVAHALQHEQWLSEEIDQSKLCGVQIMLLSYHAWFDASADEAESEAESKTDGMEGVQAEVVPPAACVKWMRRLQHAKAKACVCGAGISSTSGGGGSDRNNTGGKVRRAAYPTAPVEARRKAAEKARIKQQKRDAKRQAKSKGAGNGSGQTPLPKRRCEISTPLPTSTAPPSASGEEPVRPSQVIAEAVAAGEVKHRDTYQGKGPESTDADAGAVMPPPAPSATVEREGADAGLEPESESNDEDDDYDDSDSEKHDSDGEEQEGKDDREPGFANVDKALAGPDELLLGSGGGDGEGDIAVATVTLFKVVEDSVKLMFVPADDVPKEAPRKGWQ
jgi:3-phosphoinositide dependent protein kinase-1